MSWGLIAFSKIGCNNIFNSAGSLCSVMVALFPLGDVEGRVYISSPGIWEGLWLIYNQNNVAEETEFPAGWLEFLGWSHEPSHEQSSCVRPPGWADTGSSPGRGATVWKPWDYVRIERHLSRPQHLLLTAPALATFDCSHMGDPELEPPSWVFPDFLTYPQIL